MIAFLNDRSLETYNDWGRCLTYFLVSAQELLDVTALRYRDSGFFFRPEFRQRFNQLGLPKDTRALIRDLVFSDRYYRCWRPERVSSPGDDYQCPEVTLEMRDESICEAAQRKLADGAASIALLSAADSTFGHGRPITVLKISTAQTINLKNATTIVVLRHWLATERGYYDINSGSAPKDFQTILLKASNRFRTTGKAERRFSRQVFEEIATGSLYYVDDGHPGPSAHLEVFSARGDHIGTADIGTGDLSPSERVPGRKLKL